MKNLLVVFILFTTALSAADEGYLVNDMVCDNGNALENVSDRTLMDKSYVFYVQTLDQKMVLIQKSKTEDGSEISEEFLLNQIGVDEHSKNASYLAFSKTKRSQFVVTISPTGLLTSILQNDRSFKHCEGGLIVTSLSAKSKES